jgi:ABC-2 type transport system ATP-binding protein
MATGYLAPSAGEVLIGGVDLAREPGMGRARLGYLPESTPLYPEMQVEGYIRYRGALAGLGRREAAVAAGREIERCLLAGVRKQRVGTLSKGFRQRVGLAGALVHDPEVVILDEPGNGLDPAQIVQFRSVVSELAQKRTMLISSHILAEVERVCSRVLVIAGGELLADGSIGKLTRGSGRMVVSCGEGDGARLSVMRVNMTRQKVAEVAAGVGVVLSELREDQPSLERAFMEILEKAGRVGGGE